MKSKWVPVVIVDKCTGCSRCVEVCGVKCLEIAEGIATLPHPDTCGSEEHCITECRDDAIYMNVGAHGRKRVCGCVAMTMNQIPQKPHVQG